MNEKVVMKNLKTHLSFFGLAGIIALISFFYSFFVDKTICALIFGQYFLTIALFAVMEVNHFMVLKRLKDE